MKVLVVTGSSGGHIFPALSLLDRLKERYPDAQTLLVIPSSKVKAGIDFSGYNIRCIPISSLRFTFDRKNLSAAWRFFRGSLDSLFLLLKFRPDIVVGFGGLGSVPVVIWAWLSRAKVLLHEQNFLPGRANRLLARFSDRVAVSFSESKRYFNIGPERIVLTGNPVRRELKLAGREEALDFFGFSEDRATILVSGGSQGSRRINNAFLKSALGLRARCGFQVIHIAGSEDRDFLDRQYKEKGIPARVFAFLREMQYAYTLAHLAVCRAGATTVAELIHFRVPAIIIPYPFAYKHQLYNAEVLKKAGVALLVDDSQLDTSRLQEALSELLSSPEKIELMRSGYDSFVKVDAADLLADAVGSLNSI